MRHATKQPSEAYRAGFLEFREPIGGGSLGRNRWGTVVSASVLTCYESGNWPDRHLRIGFEGPKGAETAVVRLTQEDARRLIAKLEEVMARAGVREEKGEGR